MPKYTDLRNNCTKNCMCKVCAKDDKGKCEIGNCTEAQREGACPAFTCTGFVYIEINNQFK